MNYFKYMAGYYKALPTVEDLQEMYDFTYYSSMNAAVTDVNNGTIGTNADATKDTAVAGVYTDQGHPYVVLLKDTTEAKTIQTSVDMTINLGGHTLTNGDLTSQTVISPMGGILTIDGRLKGSTVSIERESVHAICISISTASKQESVHLIGGRYIAKNLSKSARCVNSANTTVKIYASGCDLTADGEGTGIYCVYSSAAAMISNCNLTSTSKSKSANSMYNKGIATLSNCNVRAYSNYTYGDEDYYETSSQGIFNVGTVTINDCHVMGTHSGMQNNGTMFVNGGTYESYGHGGIYFSGTGTTAYVRNAMLKDMLTMPEGYEGTSRHNGAAFYIGGAAGNDNITVYMDNCDLYGSANQGVLRGTSGEKNNSLYISNSRLHDLDGNDIHLRLDGGNHTIYIGTGNNFTEANVEFTDREIDKENPSHVVVTDEVYVS
jgi:hypothetical protein